MPFRLQFWHGDPAAALQRTLAIWQAWHAFWALPERNMDGCLVLDIVAGLLTSCLTAGRCQRDSIREVRKL